MHPLIYPPNEHNNVISMLEDKLTGKSLPDLYLLIVNVSSTDDIHFESGICSTIQATSLKDILDAYDTVSHVYNNKTFDIEIDEEHTVINLKFSMTLEELLQDPQKIVYILQLMSNLHTEPSKDTFYVEHVGRC